MLDYKLIEAFAMVIQEGGFDKAAKTLHLTQSAVSQRVKLLEEQHGQVLLARTAPPRPSSAGQRILKHYLQLKRLEEDLAEEIGSRFDRGFSSIQIGINADSLATWFMPVLAPFLCAERILLDIHVDDQEQTHQLLKNGEVMGCVSTQPNPMQGCTVSELGCMTYRAFASPAFANQWFPDGFTAAATDRAPLILFNRKDEVHLKLFAQMGLALDGAIPTQYLPSSEKFAEFIAAGLGWGMLPDQHSSPELRAGRIVNLAPGESVDVKLYWHRWNLQSSSLMKISSHLINGARTLLGQ